ncbi:MAG: potassium channel family protein [Acidimicrobiales bacterium]
MEETDRRPTPGPLAGVVRAVAIVGIALAVYFTLPFHGEHWPVAVALGMGAVVASVPITLHRVERIRTSDHPVAEAVEAVAILASLILVAFATTYYAIATNTDQIPGIHTKIDSFYFTITTVATVGFGDIVPTGQAARMIVAVQILLNISLIAGSFRLVSGAAHDRRAERQAG